MLTLYTARYGLRMIHVMFLTLMCIHAAATATNKIANKILLIDCDNTLYRDSNIGSSIETQIISNIHSFCKEHYNIPASKADELHALYGSTIEGLSDPATFNISKDQVYNFYREVYSNIDYSSLLPSPRLSSNSLTGYTVNKPNRYRYEWLPLLMSLSKLEDVTLCVSSNSPR